jgi:hypothetical protein
MLAVLAALELGTRAIERWLPTPLVWHSYEAQRKVEQMDQRAPHGVDVVFLGTSMTNAAVIPSLFDSTYGGGITAYNAALSSGRPRLMEAWGLHVVLPRLHPRLVVIGVSSLDMTDNAAAETAFLDAFRDSPAGREALGREDAVDRTDRWLREHFELWNHRAEVRSPETLLDALRGKTPPDDPVAASIDRDGYVSFKNDQQFATRPAGDGIAGVSAWSLGTEEPAALRRLLAGIEATGARAVLVELPITAEYVAHHPRKEADYAEFKTAIADLAHGANADLIDLDQARDHALFADEVHVNHTGAAQFTVALANAVRATGALPPP